MMHVSVRCLILITFLLRFSIFVQQVYSYDDRLCYHHEKSAFYTSSSFTKKTNNVQNNRKHNNHRLQGPTLPIPSEITSTKTSVHLFPARRNHCQQQQQPAFAGLQISSSFDRFGRTCRSSISSRKDGGSDDGNIGGGGNVERHMNHTFFMDSPSALASESMRRRKKKTSKTTTSIIETRRDEALLNCLNDIEDQLLEQYDNLMALEENAASTKTVKDNDEDAIDENCNHHNNDDYIDDELDFYRGYVYGQQQKQRSQPKVFFDDEEISFVTHQESLQSVSMETSASSTTTTANEKAATGSLSTNNSNNNQNDEIRNARLLLLGAAALYGTNFSLVKLLGESSMSIGLSSTLRFGMAALSTMPWLFIPPPLPKKETSSSSSSSARATSTKQKQDGALVTTEAAKKEAWEATMAGLEVGFWTSIGYVSQAVGLETTLASKSAFLCSLAVVTVPFLDVISGKKLLPRQLWGAVIALMGVAFLELGGTDLSALQEWTTGDTASLVQPLAFGMGFWRMEHAMQRYPEHANRSTAAQLLAVFVTSALYCSVTDYQSLTEVSSIIELLTDPSILLSLFWTGVITTALTVYMETVALRTLSATETTLIFSTEPLWGSAFAAVVMGERFGVSAGVGAVLILVACIYSNFGWEGMVAAVTNFVEDDHYQQQHDDEHFTQKDIINVDFDEKDTKHTTKATPSQAPNGIFDTFARRRRHALKKRRLFRLSKNDQNQSC